MLGRARHAWLPSVTIYLMISHAMYAVPESCTAQCSLGIWDIHKFQMLFSASVLEVFLHVVKFVDLMCLQ
jgi:hypothetical protein